MRRGILLAILAVAIACSPEAPEQDADTTWVGTITTEGNVTTVVNESGSVWGGMARLIEEASIGVAVGADEYMLGRVRSIAASSDHIYLSDSQVAALREYDWNGKHVRDLGRRGQGPGEFESVRSVGIDGAGRVWLQDTSAARILVFSSGGDPIATLRQRPPLVSGATPMVVTTDGRGFILDLVRETASSPRRRGMTPYGLDGSVGEMVDFPVFEPPPVFEVEGNGELRFFTPPFHPRGVFAFAPAPAMLSGYSGSYRFQVAYLDGPITVAERRGAGVPVDPGEASALKAAAVRFMRGIAPGWAWPGNAIPATKPAYTDLIPTATGAVWVVRQGPATQVPNCDEWEFEPDGKVHCWHEERLVDAFDAEGRYLGGVDVPEEFSFSPRPFIRGEDVLATVQDDAGTIMVKRYRLMLPGEE